MFDFDALLAEYTSREDPKVHGAICKCVGMHGNYPPPPYSQNRPHQLLTIELSRDRNLQ